jgi:hypothetical protein
MRTRARTHSRHVHALQDGLTGLIMAAEKGHEAVVRLLLERGAEVDKASQVGVTCPSTLHHASPPPPAGPPTTGLAARAGTRGRAGERAGA